MNILYDFQIFSYQKHGGISKYFFNLIKSISILNEDNLNLFLYAGLYLSEYGFKELNNKNLNFIGFKRKEINHTITLFYNLNSAMFYFYKLVNINKFNNSSTVFHPTYFGSTNKAANKKNKTVITIYDFIHEKFPEYFKNSRKIIENKKRLINIADKIICISNSTKDDLINYYDIDEKKIEVIYLGCDYLDMFNLESGKRDLNEKPYILFIGEREGYKNFKILLDAFYYGKLYKDFNLITFGGKEFNNSELGLLQKYSLTDYCKHLSGDDGLLVNTFKNAFCLVYSSYYEGFGLPLIEAMSLGCPVICSNSSAMAEISNNSALLFNPSDHEELTYLIKSIKEDNNLRSKLIKSGIKNASKFTWKNTAKKTINLYKSIIN